MKADVTTLDNAGAGDIELADAVFGLTPRADLLQRVVRWQLAKRRAGTHKVKGRSEIRGSGAKIWKQKGTGRARHSSRKAVQFKGGGVVFGPSPRDHTIGLPKKVRKLGLKHALSAKRAAGELIVLDAASLDEPKTKALAQKLAALGWGQTLLIDGAEIDRNFALAARNLRDLEVLSSAGANVYDILRRRTLVLTKQAISELEARLI